MLAVEQNKRKNHWWRTVIGLLITLIFLGLLAREVQLDEARHAVQTMPVAPLLLALVSLTLGYTLRIVRWWTMMRELEPSLRVRDCAWPLLVGFAFNNVLPLRAGDAMRVFAFRRQLRTPAIGIFGTVMIERLFDLMALLVFFFIGLLMLPGHLFDPVFVQAAIGLTAAGTALLIFLLMFTRQLRSVFDWASRLFHFDRSRIGNALIYYADSTFNTLDLLAAHHVLWRMVGLSMVVWALDGGVFLAVAFALEETRHLAAPFFSMATGNLATLLPSSPGYIGTFDFFAMEGLQAYGVGASIAAVFAVTVHVLLWLPITLAGFSFYLTSRGSLSKPHSSD